MKLRLEDGVTQDELTHEINITLWLINWVSILILLPEIPELHLYLPNNILEAASEIITFYTLLEDTYVSQSTNNSGDTRVTLSLRVVRPHRRASWPPV